MKQTAVILILASFAVFTLAVRSSALTDSLSLDQLRLMINGLQNNLRNEIEKQCM